MESRSNDFLLRNFYDKIREIAEQVYGGKWTDPSNTAAIDRKWAAFPLTNQKSVHSWEKFNDAISYGPDSESVIQQFIYSGNSRCSTVRLFYCNPHAKQEQKETYAYNLQNRIPYESGKHRIEERSTICTSKEKQFEWFVMKGKVLEPYMYYAEQLVTFLLKSYGLRIEQIAIDFVKDARDVIYFTDVNGFKVYEYDKVCHLALLSDDQLLLRRQEAKDIQDKANNTVQCQLCRLSYKKSEVTKIVTFKMLYELKNHLCKRGIFKFEYLENISESTLSCKVCDICYMLVVAEHELIEVEKLYAISQNIPLEEKARKTSELKKVNADNIRSRLFQWRLLFYFQEFQDIQVNALKERSQSGKLYLMVKLFDFYTTLEIDYLVSSYLESTQHPSPTTKHDSSLTKRTSLTQHHFAPTTTDQPSSPRKPSGSIRKAVRMHSLSLKDNQLS